MNLQETKLAGIGTIQWEDEDTSFETENSLEQEFAALLAEEVTNEVKEGTIVTGTIVRFTDDSVVVDIGHKSEGEIPKGEFRNAEGEIRRDRERKLEQPPGSLGTTWRPSVRRTPFAPPEGGCAASGCPPDSPEA